MGVSSLEIIPSHSMIDGQFLLYKILERAHLHMQAMFIQSTLRTFELLIFVSWLEETCKLIIEFHTENVIVLFIIETSAYHLCLICI